METDLIRVLKGLTQDVGEAELYRTADQVLVFADDLEDDRAAEGLRILVAGLLEKAGNKSTVWP